MPACAELGVPGASIGDERIVRFNAQPDDITVKADWITTTGMIDRAEAGVETRFATVDFALGGPDDTIVFQNPGSQPDKPATFKTSANLVLPSPAGTAGPSTE